MTTFCKPPSAVSRLPGTRNCCFFGYESRGLPPVHRPLGTSHLLSGYLVPSSMAAIGYRFIQERLMNDRRKNPKLKIFGSFLDLSSWTKWMTSATHLSASGVLFHQDVLRILLEVDLVRTPLPAMAINVPSAQHETSALAGFLTKAVGVRP